MRSVSFFAVAVGIAVMVQRGLAAEEDWRSDVRIDAPTELRGKDLFIRLGVKIAFAGKGWLHLLDCSLRGARVTFESDSVVTNDFRIHEQNGRIEFRDCLFRNVRATGKIRRVESAKDAKSFSWSAIRGNVYAFPKEDFWAKFMTFRKSGCEWSLPLPVDAAVYKFRWFAND